MKKLITLLIIAPTLLMAQSFTSTGNEVIHVKPGTDFSSVDGFLMKGSGTNIFSILQGNYPYNVAPYSRRTLVTNPNARLEIRNVGNTQIANFYMDVDYASSKVLADLRIQNTNSAATYSVGLEQTAHVGFNDIPLEWSITRTGAASTDVHNLVFYWGNELETAQIPVKRLFIFDTNTNEWVQLSSSNTAVDEFNKTLVYSGFRGELSNTKFMIAQALSEVNLSGNFTPFSWCIGSASNVQSFAVEGTNLTNPLVVTAPNNFEISLIPQGPFTNSISINPISQNVQSTVIYIRLAQNASTSGNFDITASSTVDFYGAISDTIGVIISPDTENPTISGLSNINVNANTDCEATSVNLGNPIVSDNCAIASVTNDAPTTFPVGTTIVTWTVTDTAGNSATVTQNVTVVDVTAPTISCPSDITVSNDLNSCSANVTYTVTATDNCESSSPLLFDFENGLQGWTFGVISGVMTWNFYTLSGTGLSFGSNGTMVGTYNNGSLGYERSYFQSPIFNSSGGGTISFDFLVNNETGGFDQEITEISFDNGLTWNTPLGNQLPNDPTLINSESFVISASEGTPTTIVRFKYDTGDSCCGETDGFFVDNVTFTPESSITITMSTNSGSSFQVGTTVVTATATDQSGNSSTCSFNVTVQDTELPTISAPANVITYTNNGCYALNVALGTPTTADNCTIASVTNNAPTTFPLGNTTVTWTVTDAAGNTATATQIVTIVDTQLPTIVAPIAINTTTNTNCTRTGLVLGNPMASDNCSVASITNDAPVAFPLGTTTVTWTVIDGSGNTATATQVVTVNDITAPSITAPVAIIHNLTSGCSVTGLNLGTPVTSDNCTVATVTNNAPTTFPIGTTTVTWTVTDGSGNSATATQTVTIVDTILPTITAPANVITSTNNGCYALNVALGTPTTADNCTIASVTNNAPTTFPLGNTTVTWTVTDAAGNTATATQIVTIVDTQVPTIITPNTINIATNTGCTATGVDLGNPITGDNCSIASVTNDAPTAFPLGNTIVTWTVIDGSGNIATAIQIVKVFDATLPIITAPTAINHNLASGCSVTGLNLGTPITSDNCSVASVTNNAPATFPIGTTTVTWTVVDGSGNSATAAQTVTIVDTILPTITAPANVITSTNNGCYALNVALGTPTTADNCTIASVTNNAPTTFPLGNTTVTWTVTDASGNTATATQVVTIIDTQLPTIVAPMAINTTTNTNCTRTGLVLGNPMASDNCSVASVTNDAPVAFPLGTTTVTWTVVDGSGNTATATQVVTVTDVILPTITAPVAIVLNLTSGCSVTGLNLGTPITSDNCSVASVTNNAPASFPIGTTTVTWTVVDGSGNSATAAQTVTVVDTILPTISAPNDVTTSTNNGCFALNVVLGTPTAADNCTIASVTNNAPTTFPLGNTTVTWTVKDASGNTATATQIVTIVDTQLPTIVAPIAINTTTNTNCTRTSLVLGNPVTSDNCSVASVTNDAPVAFPLGTTTVTWTVVDGSGNTATATQLVTVTDVTLPTITAPATVNVNANAACNATGVSLGTPVTADNCSVASVTNNAPATFPLGTTTVTWTVVDGSGNTATATQVVTVTDVTNPTITAPADITISTNDDCYAINVALGTPTIADNCSVASVTNDAPASFLIGNTTVTWTVVDASGNTATATQVVTVEDNELPTILAPIAINTTTNTDCTRTGLVLGNAVTTDNCSVASVTNDAPATFPLGTTTVTWTVVDASGNTATATQLVTVTDVTLPTITAPATVNVNANAACNATGVSLGTPVTADNCSVASVTNNAPATFPLGTTTVTWTVVDGSGNTATATQVVTVTDVTNPTITAPAAVTVPTNNGCVAINVALGTPVTADNCSIASVTNDAPATFPLGVTTVTWTIVDGSGNTATATQVVTVIDTQLPTIVAPFAINTTTNTGCTRTGLVLGNAVTTDNCSIASVTNDAPAAFPLGTTTVTWTVVDGSGNTATATQVVTVVDNLAPVITAMPANLIINNNTGNCNATATWITPTITDNCEVTITSTHNPGDVFPLGTTTVTYTATDAAGNTSTASFTVTVIDTQNPTIVAPANLVVSANNSCVAFNVTLGTPITSDNCSVASVSNNSPSVFPLGTTTVTWTVTDNAGNIATATQTVTVNDNTLPTITAPFDITVNVNNNCEAVISNLGTPIALDNCGTVTVTNNAPTAFPLGTTTVTWIATDASGNMATATQLITVVDNLAPVITNMPANLIINNNTGNCNATATWTTPTITDNCAGVTITSTHNSGDVFSLGTTTVTYTATDAAGNTSTASFTVTVIDTQNPTIVAPANLVVNANNSCNAYGIYLGTPVTADNCSIASVTNDAPATFPLGTTTVTWTIVDGSGNTATATQVVTVIDTQLPTIVAPIAINTTTNTGCTRTGLVLGNPVAMDNCSVTSVTNDAPMAFPVGSTTVTWTVTDGSGNTATATQLVTVTDIITPTVITQNISIRLNGNGIANIVAGDVNNGTFDNCAIATLVVSPSTFNCQNVGPNTVTLTATDIYGNSASATAIVTVIDPVAPIAIAQNATVILDEQGMASITADMINNNSTDNCAIASISVNIVNFNCNDLGTNTVILTVTDFSGNTATATAIVTVVTNDIDTDFDGIKNNCDDDDDNDGVLDVNDNCILQFNPDQNDFDEDGLGNACDDDDDNDGVIDTQDNCQFGYNPFQEDRDNDGIGDLCDVIEINPSEAITPNGDGINDTWIIHNIENHPNNTVKVYNRWGDLVFNARGYRNEWNGYYKNREQSLPDGGSYYYQIDLDGNGTVDHEGWLYITRN